MVIVDEALGARAEYLLAVGAGVVAEEALGWIADHVSKIHELILILHAYSYHHTAKRWCWSQA